jgi:C1A family cysteine protease
VAVGYDDTIKIRNTQHPKISSTGALLIRNSWGAAWGDAGYGWIHTITCSKNLAMDFWSRSGWSRVDTRQFQF